MSLHGSSTPAHMQQHIITSKRLSFCSRNKDRCLQKLSEEKKRKPSEEALAEMQDVFQQPVGYYQVAITPFGIHSFLGMS